MEAKGGKNWKEPKSVAKRLHRLIQPALTACLGEPCILGVESGWLIYLKFLFKHLKIILFLSQNICNSLEKDTDAGKD